jgi:glycerol-3-phosphate acyltransferase PlsY
MGVLICVACLALGYLFGSVSPAYILGQVLKNIDIREHGTRNAGTMNTYHVLGLGPAVLTVIFDMGKGLLAMALAHGLGASPTLVYLAGCAAVVGHVFPFYLGFRGGQGVATATAILLYYLARSYIQRQLPVDTIFILAFWVLSFVYIVKIGELIGSVVLPALALVVLVFAPLSPETFYLLSIVVFIFFVQVMNIRTFKLFKPAAAGREEINWRLYARPAALLFVLDYLKTGKKPALILVGAVALFFLFVDLLRLLSPKINAVFFRNSSRVFRPAERRKFSSMTIFLFAIFLTILLFDKNIAILASLYLMFGDIFGKFFGIHFGRTKVFEKTFEGSLAHFNACFLAGFIYLHYVVFPFWLCTLGAASATIAEAVPLDINDNLSVPILSAAVMTVPHLFF